MKKAIFTFLCMMALCMCSAQIYAQVISLSDGLSPNFVTYKPGDVIEYVVSVENTGDVTLLDLDIYFFSPDNPPAGSICDDPVNAGGVYVGTIDVLDPGQMVELDSGDNPVLAYEITGGLCGGEPISLVARTGTTYFAEGSQLPRCDSEISENFVEPIETPDCLIEGPAFICEANADLYEYCSVYDANSYHWSITGDAYIISDPNEKCVVVDTFGSTAFMLMLELCNVSGDVSCCSNCELDVTVGNCDAFCSYTQGYYGNRGGRSCGGIKTPDLIDLLLNLDGPVVVGMPGRSITLGSSQCIIDLLPAGGPAAVLPDGDFGCPVDGLDPIPDSILKSFKKNEARFNNVLIGQVVALSLNVRLGGLPCLDNDVTDSPLGDFVIPDGPFCTAPAENLDGCPQQFVSPISGITVNELLELANAALAGEDTGYSLSEINGAVTAMNEAFDECRALVSCPDGEICGNGCDDDFDGLVDDADSDCQIPDLIVLELAVLEYNADSIQYAYTIKNIGSGPANLDGPTAINADNVSVQAMLSQDEIFDNAGDVPAGGTILGSSPLGYLNPGDTFTGSFSSGVPQDPATFNFLTLMVDWGDVVLELNEDNNTAATPIVD